MNAEVEHLFHILVDLDEQQRTLYFEEHATDPEVRQEVQALLAYDEPGDDKLTDLVNSEARSVLGQIQELAPGSVYGPYRLLREIAHGGMAEVWLAERTDGLLKRPVALKLPYIGVRASLFAQRLNRERDILAELVHPGIARLYDAGIEDGRPYLALEFVEGTDLSTYCDGHQLPIRDRLKLFVQILSAVQHAHSRLVIHRDLKPSNILVTREGEVKLLDFGIAKLMVAGEARETELTQSGGRALTINYASPEQISGQPVTTASDVFSLGTLLYEVLSGERAFIPKRDSWGAIEEAILSFDPVRPSQAITTEGQALSRSSNLKRLRAQLRGDLDLIVLKALQKLPENRYPTADAFKADIERYLSGKPVLAQPESVRYRLQKFVLRHKLVAVSTAAAFLALVAGLSVALWQAQIARREARTAAAVQEFTEDIFRSNSLEKPDPVKAQRTTARELLDIGGRKISTSLENAPAAKSRMLGILASLYLDLGLDDQAVNLEKQRVTLLRSMYGEQNAEVVPALVDLGGAMHASRSVNESEAVLLEAKSILDRDRDYTSPIRAELLSKLGENYASTNLPKSLAFARESVDVYRKLPWSSEFASALYIEALAYANLDQNAEAEAALDEAISVSKRIEGDPNPALPRYYANKAQAQFELMRYSAAERSYLASLEYARSIGGEGDVDTLETESRLGMFFVLTSRPKQSLFYLQKATADCLRTKGPEDPFYTPQMQLQYGMALEAVGRPEDALTFISQAVANRRRNRPGTRYLGQMLEDQALVLVELGRYQEAERLLDEALGIEKKVGQRIGDNYLTPRIRLALALGRTDEASDLVERYYKAVPASAPLSLSFLKNVETRARIALMEGDAKTAIEMSGRAIDAIAASGSLEVYLKRNQAFAMLDRGRGYLLDHNAVAALPLLQGATKRFAEMMDSKSPETAAAEGWLGLAYFESGDRRKAKESLSTALSALCAHKELSGVYVGSVTELSERLRTGQ